HTRSYGDWSSDVCSSDLISAASSHAFQIRPHCAACSAEPVSAEQAAQWGLIWKACDDAALMGEAEKLCANFARGPTVGLALTKQIGRASRRGWAERWGAG